MNEQAATSRTKTEYTRRINKALIFIENNLDNTIRLDDIAAACHFSPYHFHRIFHAMMGETVNDFVHRKRMEKAAARLVSRPGMRITDVAAAGGFSSSANFAKAFKLYFGISPSVLRNPENNQQSKIGKLFSKYGKAIRPQDLYSQSVTQTETFDPDRLEELLMNIRIEDRQEQPVAYLTSPHGYELSSIFATWDKIIDWARNNGITEENQTRLAICHDNPTITPEDKCRYDAAIAITPDIPVSTPYTLSAIPAGKYAIAYYKDVASKINQFMIELCSNWLCNSQYEPDNYPPVFNYLNDSREDGYVEMEIHIKLKELDIS